MAKGKKRTRVTLAKEDSDPSIPMPTISQSRARYFPGLHAFGLGRKSDKELQHTAYVCSRPSNHTLPHPIPSVEVRQVIHHFSCLLCPLQLRVDLLSILLELEFAVLVDIVEIRFQAKEQTKDRY